MRILCLLALLATSLCPWAQAQAIDERLPADTLLFVTAPDLKRSLEQFKQTGAWAIWQEPSVQKLWTKLRGMAEKQADQQAGGALEDAKKQFKDATGLELEALPELLGAGRLTLALTGVKMGQDGAPTVDLLMSMDYDGDDERNAKLHTWALGWIKKQAEGQGATVGEEKVGDVTVHTFMPPANAGAPPTIKICIARDAKRLYLTANLDTMKRALEGSIAANTLAKNPNYMYARKDVPGDKEVGFVFVNVEAIMAAVEASGQLPPSYAEETKPMLEEAGVYDLAALGASITLEGKEVVDRYTIAMPGKRRGICKLFDFKKTDMKALRYAPANVASFSSVGYDVKGIVDEGMRLFKRFAPDEFDAFEKEQKAQFEEQLGVKIDDLIASLGTELTTFAALPETVGENPSMEALMRANYMIELKDAATFEKGLEGMLKMAGVEPTVETHHGIKMRMIPMPNDADMPGINSIAMAIHDNLLIVAMPGSELKSLARDIAAGKPGLTASETFKTQLARYPQGFTSFSYTDVAAYIRLLWKIGKPYAEESLKADGAPLTAEEAGAVVAAVLKNLTPMTAASYGDEGGMRMIYRSPIGSMSAIAAIGVGAAIAVPAVRAAQVKAKRAECAVKLKNIAAAMAQYKDDKGKYPEQFAELVTGDKKYLDDPQPFVSPADDMPMKDGDIMSSYIYIYANVLGEKDKANTIVCYNRSALFQGQRNVLYLDGTVKLVDDLTFREQFDKQKAALKEHGIQVFMGWGKTK